MPTVSDIGLALIVFAVIHLGSLAAIAAIAEISDLRDARRHAAAVRTLVAEAEAHAAVAAELRARTEQDALDWRTLAEATDARRNLGGGAR